MNYILHVSNFSAEQAIQVGGSHKLMGTEAVNSGKKAGPARKLGLEPI